jgi:hypothetical protein
VQINDLMFVKLRALGYTGALVDMLDAYRQDNEIVSWYEWYGSQGQIQPQYNDRQWAFWDALVP